MADRCRSGPDRLTARDDARARVVTVLVVSTLALGACAGPAEPLVIGVREQPSNVVLRAPDEPTLVDVGPPVPPVGLTVPTAPQPVPAIDTRYQPPPVVTTTPLLSSECPPGDPTEVPRLELPSHLDRLPAPTGGAHYTFVNEGTFKVGGANARSGTFPSRGSRSIVAGRSVAASDTTEVEPGEDFTWYEFDVEANLGNTLTTTTYVILPPDDDDAERQVPYGLGVLHLPSHRSSFPQFAGLNSVQDATPSGGLFIKQVITDTEDGRATFAPEPYLLLMPSPMQPGLRWESSGTDPISGESMRFTAALGAPVNVDACGVPLATWPVALDGNVEVDPPEVSESPDGTPQAGRPTVEPRGSASSAGTSQFTARYHFAGAYGPISVLDVVHMITTSPTGVSTERKNRSTMFGEPLDACDLSSPAGGSLACRPVRP